ncbi:MAG: cob(I)yrinic acid a,c-diamide adenosyltransferase [Christensenellales bacterium]|jgi:cob(I)alamin adenosyltransferase
MDSCVHIYTGDGKGKTTAAAGLALRALAHGMRVAWFGFYKDGASGETRVLAQLGAETHFSWPEGALPWAMDARQAAQAAESQRALLQAARSALTDGAHDLVVLDEALSLVHGGLIPAEALAALLSARAPGTETVVTGRAAPQALCDAADYVSRIDAVKHPMEAGLPARKGIEY